MVHKEIYEKAFREAIQMIDSGALQTNILAYLTQVAEIAAGSDTVSSILILDEEGYLRNGASPKLPEDYLKAIDGLQPHAELGTCAAAAATGSIVITEDFYADNKWAELRHLPLALGFKGAWSVPIINVNNKTVGTFGTYFREKRIPSADEVKGIELLASAAAIAISNRTSK